MIPQIQSAHLQSNGLTNQANFGIEITAHTFDVLIRKLYKDIPSTIIRELVSNAHDAQVTANVTTPIKVNLPTQLDPTLLIKDNGTGIAPDQFAEIYTTFFKSNRTQSNDYIGGFGLGSKCPLAYADNYTIENRHNGVKYTYAIFLNARRIPECALIDETRTDEHNGITIQIPIATLDREKFIDAGLKILPWFDNIECNHALSRPIPIYSGTHCTLYPYTNSYYNRNATLTVRIGSILYPVAAQKLDNFQLATIPINCNYVLNAPIGSVELTPSREDILYNEKNSQTLRQLNDLASAEIRDHIVREANKHPSLMDALRATYTLSRTIAHTHAWKKTPIHKPSGQPLSVGETPDQDLPNHWEARAISRVTKTRMSTTAICKVPITATKIQAIRIPLSAKNYASTIRDYILSIPARRYSNILCIVRTDDSTQTIETELKKRTIGTVEVIDFATLPKPTPKKRPPASSQPLLLSTWPHNKGNVPVEALSHFYWCENDDPNFTTKQAILTAIDTRKHMFAVPPAKLNATRKLPTGTHIDDLLKRQDIADRLADSQRHIEITLRLADTITGQTMRKLLDITTLGEHPNLPPRLFNALETLHELCQSRDIPAITSECLQALGIPKKPMPDKAIADLIAALQPYMFVFELSLPLHDERIANLLTLYEKTL